LETSQVLAHDESLVRMDRAAAQIPQPPASIPAAFVKHDGAPDVAFQGHEFFLFATDHQEFTPSGVIGNPFRSAADKGERTYDRYAEHLAAALEEFARFDVQVHTREWRTIA
jgi:creatinine amidohydrolase